jgi:hypothetical protein
MNKRISKFDGMKFKGFCAYHKADFDTRFTEEQKQSFFFRILDYRKN